MGDFSCYYCKGADCFASDKCEHCSIQYCQDCFKSKHINTCLCPNCKLPGLGCCICNSCERCKELVNTFISLAKHRNLIGNDDLYNELIGVLFKMVGQCSFTLSGFKGYLESTRF